MLDEYYYTHTGLILPMEGDNLSTSFIDKSFSQKLIRTNGDAKISTTQSKWGNGSGYFDGSSDYLGVSYSDELEVGGDDFRISFWFYVHNVSGYKTFFAFYADFHLGIFLNGARINCFAGSNGSSWDLISGDSGTLNGAGTIDVTANAWHHLEWSRSGNIWTELLDGAVDKQITVSGSVINRVESFNIGRWGNGGYWMNGYIQDFNFTKSIAGHTAAFTPPTTALWRPVTIGGTAVIASGGGATQVVIRDVATRKLAATATPNASTGIWTASVPEGTYDITYFADGYQPICHGLYTVTA